MLPEHSVDTTRFFEFIVSRAAFADRSEAERAVAAVFDAVAESLSDVDAEMIAGELPGGLADRLRAERGGRPTASGLLQQVARGEHTTIGFAREHLGVILQALSAQLSPDANARLAGALPPEIAEMIEPRQRTQTPPPPVHKSREDRSLASGRSGGGHPVSEAQPDRAHKDSVARTDQPHGDTKLSSGRPE